MEIIAISRRTAMAPRLATCAVCAVLLGVAEAAAAPRARALLSRASPRHAPAVRTISALASSESDGEVTIRPPSSTESDVSVTVRRPSADAQPPAASDDGVKVTVRKSSAPIEPIDVVMPDDGSSQVTVRAPGERVKGTREPEDIGRELVAASRDGDVRKIKRLVDEGAPLDAIDDKGFTAMHLCAATGLAPGVVVLAKAGAEINVIKQNYSPLLMAIGYNKPFTAEVLLKCGADTKLEDSEGNSALQFVQGLIEAERQAEAEEEDEGGNFITKTFTNKVNKRLDALLEMEQTLMQVPASGRVPPEEAKRNIDAFYRELNELIDLKKPLQL